MRPFKENTFDVCTRYSINGRYQEYYQYLLLDYALEHSAVKVFAFISLTTLSFFRLSVKICGSKQETPCLSHKVRHVEFRVSTRLCFFNFFFILDNSFVHYLLIVT